MTSKKRRTLTLSGPTVISGHPGLAPEKSWITASSLAGHGASSQQGGHRASTHPEFPSLWAKKGARMVSQSQEWWGGGPCQTSAQFGVETISLQGENTLKMLGQELRAMAVGIR